MLLTSLLSVVWSLGVGVAAASGAIDTRAQQDIVTYDAYSLKINDTRLFVFSGEFHPFRLPVPGLWLDIFQKIKAIGFNTVSFYVDWALLEGKQGEFSAEGIFDFQPFFDAAQKAGLYLIARPGPYINAEASGGGFPGWLNRICGYLREANPEYLEAVHFYESHIGAIVAKGQITNGGPVVLLQPENEYSSPQDLLSHTYMADVEKWYQQAGVEVPTISNDGYAYGNFAPGTGPGAVDIYGFDSYPLGFDCGQPSVWSGLSDQYFPGLTPPPGTPNNTTAANPRWNVIHQLQSPNTPLHVSEFQGGSFDSWGGSGFSKCAAFTGASFERVFYKNSYSFGMKGINYYMLYGGTNWGNLGFPYGYTSYDYGAAIREDRTLMREKYSELKLQANFFKVAPAWLLADAHDFTNDSQIANTDAITVTALTASLTAFYVVRHSNYSSEASTSYKMRVSTSVGHLELPHLGGSLVLHGRDSKIMTTDFLAGHAHILYSTTEIFTWQAYTKKTVILLYAGPDEDNEVAFKTTERPHIMEGRLDGVKSKNGILHVRWKTQRERTVFRAGDVEVYLMDRYSAYKYWVVSLNSTPQAHREAQPSVIINGGYLVRNATIHTGTLHLVGDTNSTSVIEVVGAPDKVKRATWNGKKQNCKRGKNLICQIEHHPPSYHLPVLAALDWKYADSLPEIRSGYDDRQWTLADHISTNDTQSRNLTTPTSLYASDYGYNTGALLYRTHFVANGKEKKISVETQGGSAYGVSIWLNETFLGSWVGSPSRESYYQNMTLPELTAEEKYTLTVLQDMMGQEESGPIGPNSLSKTPRGILNYQLDGHEAATLCWRLTGNLGGENYHDRTRGPLNEGGLYAERQGWFQPYPPIDSVEFSPGSPMEGILKPGVGFYTASFTLDMPEGWDIPLSFTFANVTEAIPTPYRALLFVNGYQFGKYLNHVGPQTSFPVPVGILDYHGENWVSMTLWAMENGGAKVAGLVLEATAEIQSGYGGVALSPMPRWKMRTCAY